MSVIATVLSSATGQPVQKTTFARMPRLFATFNLQSGELVRIERIEVEKTPPGKFVAPVNIWVAPVR
jgi:hypothetical protein